MIYMAKDKGLAFLSGPQWRVMDKLNASGGIARFTGVMYRTIRKLEELGLVTYTFDVVPDAVRGRHQLRYVVAWTDRGRRCLK